MDWSLEKRKEKIFGNHVFTVTPLHENREIEEESTKNLLDFVISNQVDRILVLGSTGEVFALTEDERKRYEEIVVDAVKKRVPGGVGVNDSSSDIATHGRIPPFADHDQMNYLMLLYGAKGMTSAASCVLPKEQAEMFQYIQGNEMEKAQEIFLSKFAPLNAIAFANVLHYVQCYKGALKWMGVIETDT